MIELSEARERLLQNVRPLGSVGLPLSEAAGHVLAEVVRADRPIPPSDRAAMDGYAVRSADLRPDGGKLLCVGEIRAGDEWAGELQPGTCVGIMTGAAVPAGADAVIEVEKTNGADRGAGNWEPATGEVTFATGVKPGRHVAARGEDAMPDDTLLEPGATLSPIACGLLALVGHVTAQVYERPSVALLSTGNEIVSPEATPTAYQVRDANRTIVAAVLRQSGFCRIADLGIARDEPADLCRALTAGLQHDILLTSGGVSMGVTDMLPDLLAELGVTCLLSRVAIKPGKPLWAGVTPAGKVVLAMPGNPLAATVHASEMVVPVLRKMSGHLDPVQPLLRAVLTESVSVKGDRLTLLPARITARDTGLVATPLRSHGSADLVGAAEANGLVFLPPRDSPWDAGSEVEARLWC